MDLVCDINENVQSADSKTEHRFSKYFKCSENILQSVDISSTSIIRMNTVKFSEDGQYFKPDPTIQMQDVNKHVKGD